MSCLPSGYGEGGTDDGAGGSGQTAVVHALDRDVVFAHADEVVRDFGSLDVSFSLIQNLTKRAPTLDDVANAAVLAASDWSRAMTATGLNLTGGAVVD